MQPGKLDMEPRVDVMAVEFGHTPGGGQIVARAAPAGWGGGGNKVIKHHEDASCFISIYSSISLY